MRPVQKMETMLSLSMQWSTLLLVCSTHLGCDKALVSSRYITVSGILILPGQTNDDVWCLFLVFCWGFPPNFIMNNSLHNTFSPLECDNNYSFKIKIVSI